MLYAIVLFALLGAIYALLYYLNHKTPAPAGCEDLKADCNGCKVTGCGNHPNHNI